jgi:hypothetical protein
MSERGVFAVDRGLWDHPSFADEAMSEREAFIWLIGEAAYKPRKVRIEGRVVEIQRGQVAHSLRFMADKWGWQHARVQRFLKRLVNSQIIDTSSDTGQTIITLCNYNKYQRVSMPIDAANDTGAIQQRYKEEDKEIKDNISLGALEAPQAEDSKPKERPRIRVLGEHPAFRLFWDEYPRREGNNPRKAASEQFARAVAAGADPPSLVTAARVYRSEMRKAGKEKSQYVQQAVNWLKQGNWESYVTDARTGPTAANQDTDEVTARRQLKRFFAEGFWMPGWGPKPGEPGCTISRALIDEVRGASSAPSPNHAGGMPASHPVPLARGAVG